MEELCQPYEYEIPQPGQQADVSPRVVCVPGPSAILPEGLGLHALETPAVEVPIDSVVVADSPRSAGSSNAHARVLAEAEEELPPILLHGPTMRVIDGMHRLEAAKLRGAKTISVRFFNGDEEQAFVLAVEMNVKHGLPLSLADRKAAAMRIMKAYPNWSDRAVAAKAGLAHKTVGSLRCRSSGELPQLTARVGRDGRVRSVRVGPVQPDVGGPAPKAKAKGSQTARKPTVPLLEEGAPATASLAYPAPRPVHANTDWMASLRRLRTDPSLRYTEAGRLVLRVFDVHLAVSGKWHEIADLLPEHCLDALTEFALKCADDCRRLSLRLEARKGRRR